MPSAGVLESLSGKRLVFVQDTRVPANRK